MSSDNFFTVSQVNAMALSNVGSKITKPVYFKIMSDRDLKQHNVLLVADSDKDQMEIEFDPDYLREMARRSNFLYPGSMVVGHMLEFRRRGVVFVSRNSHLSLIPNSRHLPPRIADALIPLQCEPARKDLNLKDLSETKATTGVSEEIWMKVVAKFEGGKGKDETKQCLILKVADHSARMVFKIWKATHAPLLSKLKVGDFWKFRNMVVKHQLRKETNLEEIFLQFVPSQTMMEKMDNAEIALLPSIPMEYDLGDGIFQGDIIEMSRFEWNDLCHKCENWTSIHNCKQHPHSPATNLKSYSFQMVGFDQNSCKKEFFVRKSEVEDFRDKSIRLQEDDEAGNKGLTEAFKRLIHQPLQVIFNENAKSGDLYATHISIIGTTASESKKKNKKKTVAAGADEASANKKTKYDD